MIKRMLANAKCRQFWDAALKRAWHSVWQAAVPLIPAGIAITQIDWLLVLELSLAAGVLSLAKSLAAGVPECTEEVGMQMILKESEDEINGENFFDEAEEVEGGEVDA